MPFPHGICFAATADGDTTREDNGDGGIRAFIGFSYPFRNNPWRHKVISDLAVTNRYCRQDWCNRNMWLLARIGTFERWRHNGYARRLIEYSQLHLELPYIECLTAHVDVAALLAATGFTCYGWRKSAAAYYYLWRNRPAMAAD
jgi:hypothetical protein